MNNVANNKIKLTNLLNDKVVTICFVLSLLYFISGYFNILEIAVAISVSVCFVVLPINASFCIFLFMHNFTISNIANNVGFTIIFISFVVITLIKYIIGAINGKYNVYPKIIAILSLILILSLSFSIAKPLYGGAFIYILYFPLAYLCLALKDEFNIKQGVNFMLFGLILSCCLSLIGNLLPQYSYAMGVERFQAFSFHTNYLYMRALFIIAYYMYMVLTYQTSFKNFSFIYIFCAFVTLSTLSKTGMFLLVLFSLIFIIVYLKQDFKSRYKILIWILIGMLVFIAICNQWIIELLDRFIDAFKSGNFWNSLLTDRDSIWKDYLANTFNSPVNALFGNGLLTEQPFIINQQTRRASHNLYIFLLYRFGIVGCCLIACAVYLIIKQLINESINSPTQNTILTHKPSLLSSLPLIWYLLESFCDNTFYSFNIMYLVLAILIMFSLKPYNNKKKK